MKKIIVFLLIAFISTSVFARGGSFSGGGRGFSGGSFRSSSFGSSASSGIGFGGRSSSFSGPSFRSSRPSYWSSPNARYAPSGSMSHTTIINHGGYGGGSGFMSGFMGGWLGGMIGSHSGANGGYSNNNYNNGYAQQPVVMNPVSTYVSPLYYIGQFIHFILVIAFLFFLFLLIRFFWRRANA